MNQLYHIVFAVLCWNMRMGMFMYVFLFGCCINLSRTSFVNTRNRVSTLNSLCLKWLSLSQSTIHELFVVNRCWVCVYLADNITCTEYTFRYPSYWYSIQLALVVVFLFVFEFYRCQFIIQYLPKVSISTCKHIIFGAAKETENITDKTIASPRYRSPVKLPYEKYHQTQIQHNKPPNKLTK